MTVAAPLRDPPDKNTTQKRSHPCTPLPRARGAGRGLVERSRESASCWDQAGDICVKPRLCLVKRGEPGPGDDPLGRRAATSAAGGSSKVHDLENAAPVTCGPLRVPWLSLLAGCVALVLTGCTASAGSSAVSRPARPSQPASQAALATVSCESAMLRIRAGREGEQDGAHGDIEFTSVGSHPCVLRGVPQVAIVQADGMPLQVRLVRAPDLSLNPVVLQPGALDAADLVVFWANWCGRPPGPLSVRVTLPAGGGVITGPFNGPPDDNFVPQCRDSRQPSTISVTDAYGPGLAR